MWPMRWLRWNCLLYTSDEYPESAFFNVGTIDDVIAKAKAESEEA